MLIMKGKRITVRLRNLLLDLRQRELLQLNPYEVGSIKGANNLIERGLIRTRFHINKEYQKILIFYITESGCEYLKKFKINMPATINIRAGIFPS